MRDSNITEALKKGKHELWWIEMGSCSYAAMRPEYLELYTALGHSIDEACLCATCYVQHRKLDNLPVRDHEMTAETQKVSYSIVSTLDLAGLDFRQGCIFHGIRKYTKRAGYTYTDLITMLKDIFYTPKTFGQYLSYFYEMDSNMPYVELNSLLYEYLELCHPGILAENGLEHERHDRPIAYDTDQQSNL